MQLHSRRAVVFCILPLLDASHYGAVQVLGQTGGVFSIREDVSRGSHSRMAIVRGDVTSTGEGT
jgi:hypothetical protein